MKKKHVNTDQVIRELTTNDMVKGIGRKATNEELIIYLSKNNGKPIDLNEAFSKYESK